MEATPPPPPPPPAPPTPPAPASVPAGSPPPRPGWWKRNWKWFIPAGCLSVIVLGVAFIACILLLVFGALKSSDACKTAVARAKSDSRVVEAIGSPIHTGWFVSGNTKVEGGSGESNLTIPISGPKGSAKIYAVATKSAGKWEYSKLVVTVESTGETIDLSEESAEKEKAEEE